MGQGVLFCLTLGFDPLTPHRGASTQHSRDFPGGLPQEQIQVAGTAKTRVSVNRESQKSSPEWGLCSDVHQLGRTVAIPADSRCDVRVSTHTGTKGDRAALRLISSCTAFPR